MTALPHVDEHAFTVAAPRERVWSALGEVVWPSFGSRPSGATARLLGCRETSSRGPVLGLGSTIPGFRVAAVRPGEELALEGEHHFSRYTLTFRLDAARAGRTRVAAETRAAFPGLRGTFYRAAVIGTRGHAVLMRRMMGAIRRRAEGSPGYR